MPEPGTRNSLLAAGLPLTKAGLVPQDLKPDA